jgi:hypothetical protein
LNSSGFERKKAKERSSSGFREMLVERQVCAVRGSATREKRRG